VRRPGYGHNRGVLTMSISSQALTAARGVPGRLQQPVLSAAVGSPWGLRFLLPGEALPRCACVPASGAVRASPQAIRGDLDRG
jgi:hypothetical protein